MVFIFATWKTFVLDADGGMMNKNMTFQ